MKKGIKLLFISLLFVALTGCVKINVNMKVNKNKNVTLEMVYGMQLDSSMMNGLDDDSTDTSEGVSVDQYKHLESLGYTVSPFTETTDDGTISGVKISKTFDNIDDITGSKEDRMDINTIFNEENVDKLKDTKFFYKDGNNYALNIKFDFSGDDYSQMASYSSMFDLKYTLTLPGKTVKDNATSSKNNVYTWDLEFGKSNEIEAVFNLSGTSGLSTTLIIGIVAGVAVVGVAAFLVINNKKKKTAVTTNVVESDMTPVDLTANTTPTEDANNDGNVSPMN